MSTWQALGFQASPYNSQPLKVDKEHVPLLVGRSDAGVDFCAYVDSAREGVFVISGPPGVGKTSFLNIFQYLIEAKSAHCKSKLLAARSLCPLQSGDDARVIALRVLQTLIKNVGDYCEKQSRNLPEQTEKLSLWVGNKPSISWDFSLSILGNGGGIGRSVHMPSITDATFENFQDAISIVVNETVEKLQFDGIFVGLDNVENLEDERLSELLMSFRDTLFSVKSLWWVIVGQSGLYSLIQSLDSRVSERLSGFLELPPILLTELDAAVEQRVNKFHSANQAKSPLSSSVHELLYRASYGEIRFVFKYCNEICIRFVSGIRKKLLDMKIPISESAIDKVIGETIVENQIPDALAENALKNIVKSEIDGLGLKHKEKKLLRDIGHKGSARSRDFKDFGFSSGQDFSSNYLTKLQSASLLVRSQEGRAAIYRLRGLAVLANHFSLLE